MRSPGWTLTALFSKRVVGIPLVIEHAGSFLPPVFERGLLPLPSRPVGMPLERWLPKPIRRRMFNAGASRLMSYTAGFNRIAAELGVEGVPSFAALLLGDLTLVTDVPEVLGVAPDELESWRPRDASRYRAGTRLRYTGPIYARLAVPLPARVEDFLERSRPTVYVAITSSQPQLVRDVVMPRVDLAVTAGGQGSVQTAVASGLPFIGIPLQPEQAANVASIERQGAARLVAQDDAGTPVLARIARQLLADGRYRESAQRLQAIFAAVDGPGAAADAILDLREDATLIRPAIQSEAL